MSPTAIALVAVLTGGADTLVGGRAGPPPEPTRLEQIEPITASRDVFLPRSRPGFFGRLLGRRIHGGPTC